MDTTSPFLGDGWGGPVPLWTPDVEAITAAYSAPPGFGRPRFHRTGWVRRVAAGLTVAVSLAVPAMTMFAGVPVVAAAASSHATTASPLDTWV